MDDKFYEIFKKETMQSPSEEKKKIFPLILQGQHQFICQNQIKHYMKGKSDIDHFLMNIDTKTQQKFVFECKGKMIMIKLIVHFGSGIYPAIQGHSAFANQSI